MFPRLSLGGVILGIWHGVVVIVADTGLLVVVLGAALLALAAWAISWLFGNLYHGLRLAGWLWGSVHGYAPRPAPPALDPRARQLLEYAIAQLRDLSGRTTMKSEERDPHLKRTTRPDDQAVTAPSSDRMEPGRGRQQR